MEQTHEAGPVFRHIQSSLIETLPSSGDDIIYSRGIEVLPKEN